MRRFMIALIMLLAANWTTAVEPTENGQLRESLRGTKWQWDGNGGEVITFAGSGYVEHKGWRQRGLVTRWNVIDKRTVLLIIERGRANDLYAVLTFNDKMTAYDGFNFLGGGRLKISEILHTDGKEKKPQFVDIHRE